MAVAGRTNVDQVDVVPADKLYDRAGGPNVEHWNLPETGHTAGLREEPAAYEARVAAFFDRALR